MRRERVVCRVAAWLVVAVLVAGAAPGSAAAAEDGYSGSDMWLHYVPVSDWERLHEYRRLVSTIVVENAGRNKMHRTTEDLHMEPGSTEQLVETSLEAARSELVRGLGGLLDRPVPVKATAGRRRRDRGHP